MATWKQVVLSDDVPNLGDTNLTQSSADRVFSLKQRDGDPTKKNLRFIAETTLGETSTLVDIETKDYQANGSGDANGGRFTENTQNISLNASNVTSVSASGFHATVTEAKFQTPLFQIWNTQNNGLVNPLLRLRRNSASPADGDLLGEIAFNGKDDDGNYLDYATITASIVDATNDTEDGALDIKLKTAGSSLSALKALPRVADNVTGKLDSLEVYETTLKDLLVGFQKYALKTSYKLYIQPQHANGYQENQGYIMSSRGGNDGSTNQEYIIGPGDYSDISTGAATLDGVAGDFLSSMQDAEDVGYGDAWLTYDHPSDAPAVTIEISGNLWWKPKMDPPSGQSLSIWFAHEDVAGGFVEDINENTGINFAYKGNTDVFVLSDGEEVTKMPFTFTQDIVAAGGAAKQHMFLLGSHIRSVSGVTYIGQSSGTPSNSNWGNMVADVTMRVYPQ